MEVFFNLHRHSSLEDKLSLRQMLNHFLQESEIPISALAKEIDIHTETLNKFMKGQAELKFMQAIRIQKILGISNEDLIEAYSKDYTSPKEEDTFSKLNQIAFVNRNFDIPSLKKLGIINPKAKMEQYSDCICKFFGYKNSIFEYNSAEVLPTLFSKSRRKLFEEKEAKMTRFWLTCAIETFRAINNPNDFNEELLKEIVKKVVQFTEDEINGYYRFTLVLYQIGVTVLTQAYTTGTNAYGGTMIINGKPCIIITDMGKKYHKLWISLLHELYHVINDFELLKSLNYHFSTPQEPDLLFHEKLADDFALNALIHPNIQEKLNLIVPFPIKVKILAKELKASPAIIYGVFLENANCQNKKELFAKYNRYLVSSECATKKILFDPIKKISLKDAIEKMKIQLISKKII